MMNRRKFLQTLTCGSAAIITNSVFLRCNRKFKQPNIVFILADDLGWKQIGCYGSSFYQTPYIDQLAEQGMRFTDAYAACPVCSPTRASILTGKYPARLHLTDFIPGGREPDNSVLLHPEWTKYLQLNEITMAEALKREGYATAAFGKWHLSKEKTPPGSESHNPDKQGFDESFVTYKPAPAMAREWQTPENDAHNVEIITKKSLEFIEKNRENPFFLYMSHNTIHDPLMEKQKRINKYKAAQRSDLPENNPVIAAMIETLDKSVGLVVDKLNELNLTNDTVVIFYSDNGGLEKDAAQTPLKRGKATLYEGGIRVPLIVKWLGNVAPGSLCHTPVASIDFFPTVMDIVNHQTIYKDIDGESIKPLLFKSGELKRNALYWHYPHYHNSGVAPSGAIRKGQYKLIEWFEQSIHGFDTEGAVELFDLENDIGEKRNILQENKDTAKELYKQLGEWRKQVGAQEMHTTK